MANKLEMRAWLRQGFGVAVCSLLVVPAPAMAFPVLLPPVGGMLDPALLETPPKPGLEDLLTVQESQGSNDPGTNEDRDTVRAAQTVPLSDARTAAVVKVINEGNAFCERVPWDYRVDCLYNQLKRAAAATPPGKDYAPMRQALSSAAEKMRKLRDRHADKSVPRKAFATKDGRAKVPPLQAVRRDERAEVTREANQIIAETQTVLLRSGSDNAAELEQFSRVSAALDTSKVLLRSA